MKIDLYASSNRYMNSGVASSESDSVAELRLKFAKFQAMEEGADLRSTRYEWVYFAQGGQNGLVKIGRAYRIARRMRALQSCSPVPLRLLALAIAPRGTEFLFHSAFAETRVSGEWFLPDEALLSLAKSLPKAGRVDMPQLREFAGQKQISEIEVKRLMLAGLRRKKTRRRRSVA